MIAIEEIGRITPDNLGLVTVLAGEDLGQYAQMKEKLFQVIGFNKDDLAYSYFDLSEEDYQNAELDLESLPFYQTTRLLFLISFKILQLIKKLI